MASGLDTRRLFRIVQRTSQSIIYQTGVTSISVAVREGLHRIVVQGVSMDESAIQTLLDAAATELYLDAPTVVFELPTKRLRSDRQHCKYLRKLIFR